MKTILENSNKTKSPPKIARCILSRISRYAYRDNISGDFEELYNEIYRESGLVSAYIWCLKHIVRSFPVFIITSFRRSTAMLSNYFKIAFRNVKRNKAFSFINITGLSVGMTCSILIILYINYELSFDKYHKKADDIYRVVLTWTGEKGRGGELYNVMPGIFQSAVTREIPEVLLATRAKTHEVIINHSGNLFKETGIRYVDPDFLEIFSFPLISGNAETALNEPYSLILTEDMAKKYFSDGDPLGKVLNIDKNDYKITGIIKNVPENSHFTFDFLASFTTMFNIYPDPAFIHKWDSSLSWNMYILASMNTIKEEIENNINRTFDEQTQDYEFRLQPLTDIHMYSKVKYDDYSNISDIRYVYMLTSIAVLIILIACFNYISLSTARSIKRAREVGIRKVSGAHRFNLIRQYIIESVIMAIFAFTISIFLTYFLLDFFNDLTSRNLEFKSIFRGNMIYGLFGIIILSGFISGSYPALFLSSFKPVNVIRGIMKSGSNRNSLIRSSIVVFQFMISTILIISSLIVFDQLDFIRNRDLGFKKDYIICGNVQGIMKDRFRLFKEAIVENPGIKEVYGLGVLPNGMHWNSFPNWEGKESDDKVYFALGMVEYNFIDFFKIEIMEGRNFSQEFVSDLKEAWILNETAVNAIGLEEPIGKKFGLSQNEPSGKIIAIIKDFNFSSVHKNVEPLALCLKRRDWFNSYAIKLNSENSANTINYLKEKFEEFAPDYPFDYFFLDESLDSMYRAEQKLGEIFNIFTFIAVFISCLGLFGLISYTSEQKTKEVGIRKVLGSSVGQIIYILSKELILWIIYAIAIAFPIAYFSMSAWLNNFAYRISIGFIPFVIASGLTLIIAILTISIQITKTALSNTVDTLRFE